MVSSICALESESEFQFSSCISRIQFRNLNTSSDYHHVVVSCPKGWGVIDNKKLAPLEGSTSARVYVTHVALDYWILGFLDYWILRLVDPWNIGTSWGLNFLWLSLGLNYCGQSLTYRKSSQSRHRLCIELCNVVRTLQRRRRRRQRRQRRRRRLRRRRRRRIKDSQIADTIQDQIFKHATLI